MFTQTVVLWILGIGFTLTLAIGAGLFSVVGTLLLMIYRNFSIRIDKNERDLNEIKIGLEAKISEGNEKILGAIKDVTKNSVHVNDCKSNIALIKQCSTSDAAASKKEHEDIGRTMRGILDQLESITRCLVRIQQEKECEV